MSTIIFLHGWGHSKELWKGFSEKFKRDAVYTFDLPGFGSEKLISNTWDINDYAEWVFKKLKDKKITKAVIIGHSFGGKIAFELAKNHPVIIEKLILISSPLIRKPSLKTKTITALVKKTKKILPKKYVQQLNSNEYLEAKAKGLNIIFSNSVNYDQTSYLPNIAVPVLIIWGDNDQEASVNIGIEMTKKIPNSKLEIIKRAGHQLHFEKPDLLYGLINNFIHAK